MAATVLWDRRTFLAAGTAAMGVLSSGTGAAKAVGDKIRVGQIGVGHAHASKLAVYRASADYEVVGIVEPDEDLRRQAEQQPAYRDLPWLTQEQLLNTPGLQAVLVETQVRNLLNVAEACVAAGKHVHLDKPAGESLPQFERILKSAEQQGLQVQLGYMYRYNPAVVMLREFLLQGWLGDVFEVHTVMSKVVDPAARRALADTPGGMMFELGCHILDLVVGVLGEPTHVQSFAQHTAPIQDSLLDNMLAVLSYPHALATVKSSAQEVDGFARRQFTVCGTQGTFHIQPLDNPQVTLSLDKARGPYKAGTQQITLPKYERYVGDAADMAQIIRGEKKSNFPWQHELAVQRTLLKACQLPLDR